jgi:hypothetical protein
MIDANRGKMFATEISCAKRYVNAWRRDFQKLGGELVERIVTGQQSESGKAKR